MDDAYFQDLKEGLADAIAYEKGDHGRCRVQVVHVADPQFNDNDIRQLRLKLNLSQAALASALGVSHRTVESWESGNNIPSGPAKHLLYLFDRQPELVNDFICRK